MTWTLDELEKRLFPVLHGRRQAVVLFIYYFAILIALLLIYGQGDFVTAPFVYQGF